MIPQYRRNTVLVCIQELLYQFVYNYLYTSLYTNVANKTKAAILNEEIDDIQVLSYEISQSDLFYSVLASSDLTLYDKLRQ